MSISSQGPEGMILGGRYRIVRLIGSGGMANVYLALDMTSGMNVAIKILKQEFSADQEFIKRFDTEARAASSLTHPNIVRVLGVGQEGDFRYMVQEYVEGITVKELITQNGHLDWRVAVPIAIQVGMALDNAHMNGVVHRDIKPHNILISRDRIAKVTDFGIARAASANTITLTSGGALGSVHYFSPEQARGSMVGPSTDIYSLGVLLFEMITGRVPFDGDTSVAIAIKHLQEQPPLASSFIPGIPQGLDAIILKCMQKSPDYRYATIHEMVSELDSLMVDPNGAYGIISRSEAIDAQTGQMQAMRHESNYGKLKEIEHAIEKRRRSRTKDNVLVILLVTIIVGVLIGGGVLIYRVISESVTDQQSETFTVGNYVGENISDVLAEFAELGFTDYELEYEISTTSAPGIVMEQSLSEGIEIKPDNGLNKLVLTVSSSEDAIVLDDYSGQDALTVQQTLTDLGLSVTLRTEASKTIEEGLVIRTEPGEGSQLFKGDQVVVVSSEGITTVVVPPLAGLTLDTAESVIMENGLSLGDVEIINSAAEALPTSQQIVLMSDPGEGEEVTRNSAIKLYVGTAEDYQRGGTPTPSPTPATYEVTVTGDSGQGSVSGAGVYIAGSSVTLTATPKSGYVFINWVDQNNVILSTSAMYTFTMPTNYVYARAVYGAIEPTVTPTPNQTPVPTAISEG